jgi:hypothetical protein
MSKHVGQYNKEQYNILSNDCAFVGSLYKIMCIYIYVYIGTIFVYKLDSVGKIVSKREFH